MKVEAARAVSRAALAILPAFYLALLGFGFRDYAHSEPGGFPVFYTAGKLARVAGMRHLYEVQMQNLFHPASINSGGYFYHLPYELAVLAPLSLFSQDTAFAVWTVAGLGCLLVSGLILQRNSSRLPVCLGLFAFAPMFAGLINGQDIAFFFLLLTLSFVLFADGKEAAAGALLAVGLFRIQFVLPMAVILGWRYRRFFVSFLLTAMAVLACGWALVGTTGMLQFVSLARGIDATEYAGCLGNLRGFVEMASGRSHPLLIIIVSCVLVTHAARRMLGRAESFAAALLVTLLVSYHSHFYDELLLGLPLALILRRSRWPTALVFLSPIFLFWPHAVFLWAPINAALCATLWRDRSIAQTCPQLVPADSLGLVLD